MGLFASSILVKYSLLNNSGSLVYTGTSSKSLRIWGAQVELAEYSENLLQDYINNFRYIRTTGIAHSIIDFRIGSGAGGDVNGDYITIGGSSGTRMDNVYAENVKFFVNKMPLRGLDLGTVQVTTSISVVTSILTTTSTTNMFVWSEDFKSWTTSGSINTTSYSLTTYGLIAPSPMTGPANAYSTALDYQNATLITWPSHVPGTVYQSIAASPYTDYHFSIWLRVPDGSSNTVLWLGSSTNNVQEYQTSITITSNWTRFNLPRPTTSGGTNSISFRIDNSNYALGNTTSKPAMIYAWGAQAITSNSTVSSLGYSYYVRTTGTGLYSVPVSSSGNRLFWSEDFTQANWTAVTAPCTFTAVANYSPEGTTAYLVEDNSLLADGAGFEQAFATTHPRYELYGVSIFARRHSAPAFDLYNFFTGTSTRGSYVRYNFDTDTLTASAAEGPGVVPSNVTRTRYANGWVRISYTVYDAAFSNTNFQFRVYPSTRDTNVVGATYFWGAQVTQASHVNNVFGQPYARSTGTLVSTSADRAQTSITVVSTATTIIYTTSTAYLLSENFSGVTTISGADHDRLFVGQRYGSTRLSGDPQERIGLTTIKRLEINTLRANLTSDYYNAITYSTSGGFVAVTNPINSGTVATFATSEDGTTWRQVYTGVSAGWTDINYGPAGYLAVAANTSTAVLGNATSPRTWNNLNSWSSVTLPFRADTWNLGVSTDLYLAAPGYTSTVTSVIVRSHNGVTWTTVDVGVAANWAGIAWSSGLSSWALIAHNTSTVMISKNATTWTSSDLTINANWQDIAASPSLFMAVAANTSVAIYSVNGTSWTTTALPQSSVWTGITWGDGSFIAVNERTRASARTIQLGVYVLDLSAPSFLSIDLAAPGSIIFDLDTEVYLGGVLWDSWHNYNGTDLAFGNNRWVFVNSKQHRWNRNKQTDRELTADNLELSPRPNWYQLAPYRSTYAERTYAQSALLSVKKENPLTDWVTIGENSASRMQTGESNLENVALYQHRRINEGERISQIPKYDAAQILGLFVNAKNRNYSSSRWTIVGGNYTYLDTKNWYSLTPLTTRSLWALDEYGNSPIAATSQITLVYTGSNVSQIPNESSGASLFVATFGSGTFRQAPSINIVDNSGNIRMTNYLDFDYMAEDYVGESRQILY